MHDLQQEELWLVRGGDPARHAPPDVDALYDAFKHPRAERPSLPLLPPLKARAYDHEVRGRVLDLIEHTPADELFTAGMVVQHEEQHDETMLATLQLRQGPPVVLGRRPLPPGRDVEPDQVFVGGGPLALGVDAASEPFSLDNERPAHTVDVGPFWIGRVPVSNRQWREFTGDGGYQRQDLWSARGWAHRIEVGPERPLWPRSGQSKPRKTAYPLPAGAGLLVSAAIGPGRRGRAGRASQDRARRGERRTRRRRRRLDFHDLRHTGNTLTANAGANLRELMARSMGHLITQQ